MNVDPQQANDPFSAKRGVAARRHSTTVMACSELQLRKMNRWCPATMILSPADFAVSSSSAERQHVNLQ
jgi:hypothetical protein